MKQLVITYLLDLVTISPEALLAFFPLFDSKSGSVVSYIPGPGLSGSVVSGRGSLGFKNRFEVVRNGPLACPTKWDPSLPCVMS